MVNKAKILIVVPSLRAGGSEKIMSLIAKYLNKSKYDVFVLVIDSRNSFYNFDSIDEVSVIKLKTSRISYSFLHLISTIWKLKPDIILSTITHLNTYLCLLKPIFFFKSRLIIRESNVLKSFLKYGKFSKNRLVFFLLKLAYPLADIIVCQSFVMRKEMETITSIGKGKLRVINNPVSEPYFESLQSSVSFDILAVGSLTKIKGYDRMIKVFSLLNQKGITLGIIGEGDQFENLKRKIEMLGLRDRVFLLGKKGSPSQFMRNSKLLLITSYFEAFPNVVLEAGMVGLPVVGFNMPGGISEIITDGRNGYLVKDGDYLALKKQIELSLDRQFDHSKIIEETRTKFGTNYIVSQYEDLFENLLANEKR